MFANFCIRQLITIKLNAGMLTWLLSTSQPSHSPDVDRISMMANSSQNQFHSRYFPVLKQMSFS